MDVNPIGSYNQSLVTAKKAEKSADIYQKSRQMQHITQTGAEPGAVAQISDEAKKMHSESNFTLQKLDENSPFPFKELEEFFSMDREQRSEKLKDMLPQREQISLDPYIQYIFPEGSLGSFLTEQLAGKVDNPSYAAKELRDMIYGGMDANPDATAEERAITREAGLKLAEYISQNYFDDQKEGTAFLDTVKMYAEKNLLSQKGYIVFENSDMKPLKPYNTLTGAPADYVQVSLADYAKKYHGITEEKDFLANRDSIMKAYLYDSVHNPQRIKALEAETVKNFAANEKNVQTAVDKAQKSFKELSFDSGFINGLSDVLHSLNQPDTAKWASDILNLFNKK